VQMEAFAVILVFSHQGKVQHKYIMTTPPVLEKVYIQTTNATDKQTDILNGGSFSLQIGLPSVHVSLECTDR